LKYKGFYELLEKINLILYGRDERGKEESYAVIEVRNLTKKYGKARGVEELTFTVDKGEILGFLGPNGAGKTTTMRIITGYLAATSGTVKVDGFDVFEDAMETRRRIGYLPENPPLYREMTVGGYLRFVSELKGIPKSKRKAATSSAAEGRNITCAKDMGTYLEAVMNFSKAYPDMGSRLLDDMSNPIYHVGIPGNLPDRVVVAHKEGDVSGIANDVGIVFGNKPYILVILSKGVSDIDEGFARIALISKMVYDYQKTV
jgi:ABC-type dipeptide/oligopeptide/nickel transport system ATPase component